jgi:titin
MVGLTNADNYTFTVTATNVVGTSAASTASSAVTPAAVTAVEISAGGNSDTFCARLSNGTAVCWGRNAYGQLGDGSTTNRSTPVAVKGVGGVGLLTSVTSLGGGQQHRCAVLTSGGLACWGRNSSGQLGDGTIVDRPTPVRVANASGGLLGDILSTRVASVAGGYYSTCAVLVSGNVLCWGTNIYGQLGDGTTTTRLKPVSVTGVGGTGTLSGISAISSAGVTMCALQVSGGVVCWGYNDHGALGDGTTTTRFNPVQVKGVGGSGSLSGVSAISTTQRTTCALVSGAVYCWGAASDGVVTASGVTPSQVPGAGGSGTLSDVTSISGDHRQTCGVLSSGDVVCWYTGVFSMSRSGVVALAGGGNATMCSLLAVGSIRCWGGTNSYGQFGNGTLTVDLVNLATAIAAPPTTPTVVSKASQQATVSWTGATGAIRYTVTALDLTNSGRGGQTCTTGSTSCTLTGLTNGDNYTFAVKAYNGFLTSAASVSTSSTAITGTPVAPTALVATVLSDTSASIGFTAGSNGGSAITKYQYSTNAGSTWADVSSGGTSSPVSITGLTAMTKYSITLRAVNATGNGESSLAVSVTPMEQALRGVSVPGLTDNGWKAVNSVSCASVGNCSAGGYYVDRSVNYAFVASQVDGVWQTKTVVAGIPVTATESQVTSVSCASAGNCSAGGFSYSYDASTGANPSRAFVLTQVNGVWGSAVDVPGLADIDLGNTSRVNAVSCASAGNCAAGGFYNYDAEYGYGVTHPFVVAQVAGVWQSAIEVPGGGWAEWASGEITSVSCPSDGNCVAGGWSTGEPAFVVSLVDGVWQNREAIDTISSTVDDMRASRVSSVSCSSVGNCTAVGNTSFGDYFDAFGDLNEKPLSFVATQVDGVWQSAVDPNSGFIDNTFATLSSVSCPSDGNCSAVGSYVYYYDVRDDGDGEYGFLVSRGVVVSQINGVWQAAEGLDTSWDLNSQLSISCWSSGNCRAGGESSTVTQSSGTWGSPTGLSRKALSVSCPTENCTIGGEGTNASYIRQNGNKFASAPVGLVATALNASVSIAFVPGDLGVLGTVTKYQYSKDNGSWTDVSAGVPASPSTITGLTNGTAVSIRLRAVNATGAGAPSDALSVTSATTPSAPTGFSATATSGGASITFTAGASGGSAITKYQYTTDNGSTWVDATSVTASMVSINGLTDGTTYSVKLRAVNAMGNGAAAASATSVTPRSTAWMPTSLVATPGDGSASIAFTAPGSDGSSAITNYKYELNGSGTYVALSPTDATSPVTIPGLTNGTTYSVKLLAVNAAGDGYGSDSVSVTPVSPATVPAAPTTLAATPGNGSASIAFTAGADGGASITNYKYQLDGGSWVALSPTDTTSPVTIPGLTNGTSYSVKLLAMNSVGDGTASTAVVVTPRAVPAAPTSLVVTPGNNTVSVAFTAGSSNGSPITNYEYELNGSENWFGLSPLDGTSPVSIAVSNGVSYTVKLRAVNEAGSGAASVASDSFTPRTIPSGPTGLAATPGDGSASIAFTAGADGGATISKYQYRVGSGAWTDAVGTTSPITVSGLTNFAVSKIKLRAVNEAGNGAVSVAVAVTTRLAGPSVFAAKASGTSGIVVSFTLTPLSGTTVSYQSVTAYARGTSTVVGTCRTYAKQTSCYIGGLTRATDYDLRATAYLPVIGKTFHNATLEGTIREVRTNR